MRCRRGRRSGSGRHRHRVDNLAHDLMPGDHPAAPGRQLTLSQVQVGAADSAGTDPDEHLGHRDRRRWHLHFTPTSSSWVNLIERWFKELTDKRLPRGVFTNVPELVEAITTWGSHWNEDPSSFIWHASADEIIEKVQRGRAALNRQTNSTTEH